MEIDLLADDSDGIDLLADESVMKSVAKQKSFYDLSKEDQAKAMDLARRQISAANPNMPTWLRDMMLTITPKDKSPRLERIANEAEAQTNFIPVTTGGLVQGFALPAQGVASMIPGKIAENFSNTDFASYFPKPRNTAEEILQTGGEIAGSLGPLGKLFGALKSGSAAARIPKALQNATALTGTGIIATPGDTSDKALGAAGALALGGAGKLASATATKVPAFLRGLTNESNSKLLAESVQKPHDILDKTANQLYDYVKSSIKKRNVSTPIKTEYISQAEEVLPKTRASKKLIEDAKSGNYEAVHDLQSQLYKKGTAGLASDDIALQNQGDEILDLRGKINDELKDTLIKSGNVDIAHVLEQGKSTYKKLMDTYFNKNLPKGIGKLVHSDIRLIPEKSEKLFSQNSKPMNKFLQQHPEAAKHLEGIKEKENAKKALGKIFGATTTVGALGGVGYAGKSLYDLLK